MFKKIFLQVKLKIGYLLKTESIIFLTTFRYKQEKLYRNLFKLKISLRGLNIFKWLIYRITNCDIYKNNSNKLLKHGPQ